MITIFHRHININILYVYIYINFLTISKYFLFHYSLVQVNRPNYNNNVLLVDQGTDQMVGTIHGEYRRHGDRHEALHRGRRQSIYGAGYVLSRGL